MAGWPEWRLYTRQGGVHSPQPDTRARLLRLRVAELPEKLEHGSEAIYALLDQAWQIQYIGRTVNPRNRFRQHASGACEATAAWVRACSRRGELPRMTILEVVRAEDASAAEAARIEAIREQGYALLNASARTGRRASNVQKRAARSRELAKRQITENLALPFRTE